MGVQRRAVGPLQALAHGKGIGQAVGAHLAIGGEVRLRPALGVADVEPAEAGAGQNYRVHGHADRRVYGIRLAEQVDTQRIGALYRGILEIGKAKGIVVHA